MLGWATFVVAARAGNVPLEMAVFVGSLANVWTAKTGIMSQTVVGFEYVPGWYPDHVRQKMMSEVEVQVERRQFLLPLVEVAPTPENHRIYVGGSFRESRSNLRLGAGLH